MTGAEIIQLTRQGYLFDNSVPYTWSNYLLERFLNDSEQEACRRSSLLVDKTTASDLSSVPLCLLNLVAETSSYAISQKIIRIRKCVPSWNSIELEKKTEGWLNEFYPDWRLSTGTPVYFLEEKGEITLVPQPIANESQAVSSITRVGSVATVGLVSHGFDDGATVTHADADQAEYNVTAVITKIDDDSYSYTVSGTPDTPATGTITATLVDTLTLEVQRLPLADMVIGSKVVTGITRSGAVATVNLPDHGYSTDDTVTHEGANQAEYNTTAVVTRIDDDNYSFPVSGTPATPATGDITSTSSESPEVAEEYHFGLIDWITYRALGNHDKDTEHIRKSLTHEALFSQRFGPPPSAIKEGTSRRNPKNRRVRDKEFGFS
jgi:hypothetical protein